MSIKCVVSHALLRLYGKGQINASIDKIYEVAGLSIKYKPDLLPVIEIRFYHCVQMDLRIGLVFDVSPPIAAESAPKPSSDENDASRVMV